MGLFSKTPEEERYEYGRQQGEMLRNNPALLKMLMEQQQTAAQAGQRQQYLTGLMGQQAAPAQYEQQTQPVEGPMMPGQERGLMGVNQQTEEAVEGSGVLGGKMPTSEVAMRLMMAPTKETRAVGGTMLNQQMKPTTPGAAQSPYTNVRFDKNSGRSYGFNPQSGRMEEIPGVSGVVEPPEASEVDELSIKDRVGAANTLGDDYSKASDTFEAVSNAWDTINYAHETGTGDLAAVIAYMKLLDPGSIVRESEVESATMTTGQKNRIFDWITKARSGRLPERAIKDIKAQARTYYDRALRDQRKVNKLYSDRAKRFTIDPRNVVKDLPPELASVVESNGMTPNADGTFTMPDGTVVRRKMITRPPDGQVRRIPRE